MFGSFKLDEAQILEAVLEIRHLEQYSGFHWVSHSWETENCVVGSFVLTLRQLMPFFPHPLIPAQNSIRYLKWRGAWFLLICSWETLSRTFFGDVDKLWCA